MASRRGCGEDVATGEAGAAKNVVVEAGATEMESLLRQVRPTFCSY